MPLRKLADGHGLSPAEAYSRVIDEFDSLRDNTELTITSCAYQSPGVLILDGKFVKVRGYAEKIPFIYGMDYASHDILVAQLSTAESGVAFDTFFAKLKATGYPLKIVVADDRSAIRAALKRHFPDALIQRCQAHYLENVRQVLHLRTNKSQSHFFNSLKKHVFDDYVYDAKLDEALHHVLTERCDGDPLKQNIVMDISARREELFAYTKIQGCPPNTNLIELYNSHLNGRLKTIKGFKSFHAAERWLNAYVLRRRTKKLTDCGAKFKHLNGTCSLEHVLKPGINLSKILLKNAPNPER